jgi:hypothetical protein
MRGIDNLGDPAKTKMFEDNQIIPKEIAQSMANVTRFYIADVNHAMGVGSDPQAGFGAEFGKNDVARFLTYLGKYDGPHDTIKQAEAAFVNHTLDRLLAGNVGHPQYAANIATNMYGAVAGALDFGRTTEIHHQSNQADLDFNAGVARRYQLLSEALDAGTGELNVGADKLKVKPENLDAAIFIDIPKNLLEERIKVAQKDAEHDHGGSVAIRMGDLLADGEQTSQDLVSQAYYRNNQLHDLPAQFYVNGKPKPMQDWTADDIREFDKWQHESDTKDGPRVLGQARIDAGAAYSQGLAEAKKLVLGTP